MNPRSVTNFIALGILGITLATSQDAYARPRNDFLETIGISIAVGTVLGASTLPFSPTPANNLIYIAYGAAAGAVVGLGINAYEWLSEPSGDRMLSTEEVLADTRSFVPPRDRLASDNALTGIAPLHAGAARTFLPPNTRVWMPLVSLTW